MSDERVYHVKWNGDAVELDIVEESMISYHVQPHPIRVMDAIYAKFCCGGVFHLFTNQCFFKIVPSNTQNPLIRSKNGTFQFASTLLQHGKLITTLPIATNIPLSRDDPRCPVSDMFITSDSKESKLRYACTMHVVVEHDADIDFFRYRGKQLEGVRIDDHICVEHRVMSVTTEFGTFWKRHTGQAVSAPFRHAPPHVLQTELKHAFYRELQTSGEIPTILRINCSCDLMSKDYIDKAYFMRLESGGESFLYTPCIPDAFSGEARLTYLHKGKELTAEHVYPRRAFGQSMQIDGLNIHFDPPGSFHIAICNTVPSLSRSLMKVTSVCKKGRNWKVHRVSDQPVETLSNVATFRYKSRRFNMHNIDQAVPDTITYLRNWLQQNGGLNNAPEPLGAEFARWYVQPMPERLTSVVVNDGNRSHLRHFAIYCLNYATAIQKKLLTPDIKCFYKKSWQQVPNLVSFLSDIPDAEYVIGRYRVGNFLYTAVPDVPEGLPTDRASIRCFARLWYLCGDGDYPNVCGPDDIRDADAELTDALLQSNLSQLPFFQEPKLLHVSDAVANKKKDAMPVRLTNGKVAFPVLVEHCNVMSMTTKVYNTRDALLLKKHHLADKNERTITLSSSPTSIPRAANTLLDDTGNLYVDTSCQHTLNDVSLADNLTEDCRLLVRLLRNRRRGQSFIPSVTFKSEVFRKAVESGFLYDGDVISVSHADAQCFSVPEMQRCIAVPSTASHLSEIFTDLSTARRFLQYFEDFRLTTSVSSFACQAFESPNLCSLVPHNPPSSWKRTFVTSENVSDVEELCGSPHHDKLTVNLQSENGFDNAHYDHGVEKVRDTHAQVALSDSAVRIIGKQLPVVLSKDSDSSEVSCDLCTKPWLDDAVTFPLDPCVHCSIWSCTSDKIERGRVDASEVICDDGESVATKVLHHLSPTQLREGTELSLPAEVHEMIAPYACKMFISSASIASAIGLQTSFALQSETSTSDSLAFEDIEKERSTARLTHAAAICLGLFSNVALPISMQCDCISEFQDLTVVNIATRGKIVELIPDPTKVSFLLRHVIASIASRLSNSCSPLFGTLFKLIDKTTQRNANLTILEEDVVASTFPSLLVLQETYDSMNVHQHVTVDFICLEESQMHIMRTDALMTQSGTFFYVTENVTGEKFVRYTDTLTDLSVEGELVRWRTFLTSSAILEVVLSLQIFMFQNSSKTVVAEAGRNGQLVVCGYDASFQDALYVYNQFQGTPRTETSFNLFGVNIASSEHRRVGIVPVSVSTTLCPVHWLDSEVNRVSNTNSLDFISVSVDHATLFSHYLPHVSGQVGIRIGGNVYGAVQMQSEYKAESMLSNLVKLCNESDSGLLTMLKQDYTDIADFCTAHLDLPDEKDSEGGDMVETESVLSDASDSAVRSSVESSSDDDSMYNPDDKTFDPEIAAVFSELVLQDYVTDILPSLLKPGRAFRSVDEVVSFCNGSLESLTELFTPDVTGMEADIFVDIDNMDESHVASKKLRWTCNDRINVKSQGGSFQFVNNTSKHKDDDHRERLAFLLAKACGGVEVGKWPFLCNFLQHQLLILSGAVYMSFRDGISEEAEALVRHSTSLKNTDYRWTKHYIKQSDDSATLRELDVRVGEALFGLVWTTATVEGRREVIPAPAELQGLFDSARYIDASDVFVLPRPFTRRNLWAFAFQVDVPSLGERTITAVRVDLEKCSVQLADPAASHKCFGIRTPVNRNCNESCSPRIQSIFVTLHNVTVSIPNVVPACACCELCGRAPQKVVGRLDEASDIAGLVSNASRVHINPSDVRNRGIEIGTDPVKKKIRLSHRDAVVVKADYTSRALWNCLESDRGRGCDVCGKFHCRKCREGSASKCLKTAYAEVVTRLRGTLGNVADDHDRLVGIPVEKVRDVLSSLTRIPCGERRRLVYIKHITPQIPLYSAWVEGFPCMYCFGAPCSLSDVDLEGWFEIIPKTSKLTLDGASTDKFLSNICAIGSDVVLLQLINSRMFDCSEINSTNPVDFWIERIHIAVERDKHGLVKEFSV